ncbi:MAG: hypothetical protein K0R98_1173 [Rickettsiaceae bacterium]|jgi:hypothetical protein|nr:hypothetical protein [Rickettsiaceae bacterium]
MKTTYDTSLRNNYESLLDYNDDHHDYTGDVATVAPQAPTTPITRFFSKKVDKIKIIWRKLYGVDGIDDGLSAAVQPLPPELQPYALLFGLVGGDVLIWPGVKGMIKDYKEGRERYKNTKQKRIVTEANLRQLSSQSEAVRQFIAKEFGIKLDDKTPNPAFAPMPAGMSSIDQLAYNILQYETIRNKELIAKLEKNWGWLGALGMSGMFAAVAGSAGKAFNNILKQEILGPNPADSATKAGFDLASTALNSITGMIFFIGQAAMVGFSINKAREGKMSMDLLEKHIERFKEYADDLKSGKDVQEVMKRLHHYQRKTNFEYGIINAVAQIIMAIGSLAGVSGAGLPITLTCSAVGTGLTGYAVSSRIVFMRREKNFKGMITDYSKKYTEKFDLLNLFHEYEKDKNIHQKIIKKLDLANDKSLDRLAMAKLLSLLNHIVNDKKYRDKSPDKQMDLLVKMLKGNDIAGSHLEPTPCFKAKNFFALYKNEIRDFLASTGTSRDNANIQLAKWSTDILRKEFTFSPSPSNDIDSKKILKILDQLNLKAEAIYAKLENGEELCSGDYKKLASIIINRTKGSFKAIRMQFSDSITFATEMKTTAEKLKEASITEADIEKCVEPSLQPISFPAGQMDVPHAMLQQSKVISHSDAALLVEAVYNNKPLPTGYAFYKEIENGIDKNGNKYILYQHPDNSAITEKYIWDKSNNNKLIIQHSHQTNAIFPVAKCTGNITTGLELHSVHNGIYEGGAIAHHGTGISSLHSISNHPEEHQRSTAQHSSFASRVAKRVADQTCKDKSAPRMENIARG